MLKCSHRAGACAPNVVALTGLRLVGENLDIAGGPADHLVLALLAAPVVAKGKGSLRDPPWAPPYAPNCSGLIRFAPN